MSVPERYVRVAEATERSGYSLRTLRRKMDAGKFPPCVWLDAKTRAWPVEAFEAWMANPLAYALEAP